jgi:ribosomal protein L22
MATAVDTPTVRAHAKWVRTSARKARVVAEHIRGRSVPEARAVLAFTTRAAARDIEKVLASAVANAESRPDLGWHGDELYVSSVTVDEGPTLKRWRARARGRVARIKKRTCHITVTLAQVEVVAAPPKPKKEAAEPKQTKVAPASKAEAAPAEEKPKRASRAAKPKAPPKPRTPRRSKKTESEES